VARAKELTSKVYIDKNGESVLWYEVNSEGVVTWHLSEEETEEIKNRMLENIGRDMSDYINNHPEATLWGATNTY